MDVRDDLLVTSSQTDLLLPQTSPALSSCKKEPTASPSPLVIPIFSFSATALPVPAFLKNSSPLWPHREAFTQAFHVKLRWASVPVSDYATGNMNGDCILRG